MTKMTTTSAAGKNRYVLDVRSIEITEAFSLYLFQDDINWFGSMGQHKKL